MNITCQNCEQLMEQYLCNIPWRWRKEIAKVICAGMNAQASLDCQAVKNCETVTTLSAFSIDGTEICITYTDEDSVAHTRCFDWQDIMDSSLIDVDPKCLMSQEEWSALTFVQQVQAIIDYACDCEITTTTTTTL